jgi:Clathrin light chain
MFFLLISSVFNQQFQAKLEERKNVEAAAEDAVKAKAKEDIALWTQQREIRLNAKKDTNRSEEQVLLETLYSDADGNAWERVTKLIDVTSDPEASKADVSRMKKLFIQLKNEPVEPK